jgi:tetratricopeptide (TPR) repeat protein
MTQRGLGAALTFEGERASGDKAIALFDQAVQAFQMALEVYTKAALPQDWAMTQNNLGGALQGEAELADGEKAIVLLDQAVQAYQKALEVRTKADLPRDWAMTQNNLGGALEGEAELASGEKAAALLDQAVQAYEKALEVFTKAGLPGYWAGVEMNLEEIQLRAGHFDSCLREAGILSDDTFSQSNAVIRDVVRLACQWGAGDKSAALATEKALLANAATPTAGLLNFTGANHVPVGSPAFATGRDSWIALFTAVQNSDSAGMTAALHQLEPILQQ